VHIARDLQNAVTRTQKCANARDWPTTVARTYFLQKRDRHQKHACPHTKHQQKITYLGNTPK